MVEVPFPPVTRRARNKKQKRDESLSANLAVKANFASAYPQGPLRKVSSLWLSSSPELSWRYVGSFFNENEPTPIILNYECPLRLPAVFAEPKR